MERIDLDFELDVTIRHRPRGRCRRRWRYLRTMWSIPEIPDWHFRHWLMENQKRKSKQREREREKPSFNNSGTIQSTYLVDSSFDLFLGFFLWLYLFIYLFVCLFVLIWVWNSDWLICFRAVGLETNWHEFFSLFGLFVCFFLNLNQINFKSMN